VAFQIQHVCPNCGNTIPIPAQYVGRVKCRYCSHIFSVKGQLHEQRKYILERLADFEACGFHYVRWSTANDVNVCPLCAERNNRLFSIDEIKLLIQSKFCQAKDFWQGCRCAIVAAKAPADILKKPKRNRGIKVISNIKTEMRNGELTKVIQFDLKINKRQLAKLKRKSEKTENGKNKF